MTPEFDQHAANYSSLVQESLGCCRSSHDYFLRVKAEHLLKLVSRVDTAGIKRLLDVGCGVGLMHPWLMNPDIELHGTDVSLASLNEARQRNSGASYTQTDGVSLPFTDGSFDVVFAVCALHHIIPSQRESFVKDMARVIRPNGLVVIYEHNPFNPLTQLVVLRSPLDKDALLLTPARCRSLMRLASLVSLQTDYLLFSPFDNSLGQTLNRWCRRVPLGAQYVSYGQRP